MNWVGPLFWDERNLLALIKMRRNVALLTKLFPLYKKKIDIKKVGEMIFSLLFLDLRCLF